jgi:peptide deformylase
VTGPQPGALDGGRMLLKIHQVGSPVLRAPARALAPDDVRTRDIQDLIAAMWATMRDAPGVGLAAPQVGESLRLAVIEVREEYVRRLPAEEVAARGMTPVPFQVLVNPELTVDDAATERFFEGCLSLAGYGASVPRARGVRVTALDARGEPIEIRARAWYARILQHEIDHLAGTLYIDRMDSRSFASRENYERYAGGRSSGREA